MLTLKRFMQAGLGFAAAAVLLAGCAMLPAQPSLTEKDFARVEVGKSSREDVQRELGRPATVTRMMSWKGDVLVYRWRDHTGQNMQFWVYLDDKQVVQQVGQSMAWLERGSDSDNGGDRSK